MATTDCSESEPGAGHENPSRPVVGPLAGPGSASMDDLRRRLDDVPRPGASSPSPFRLAGSKKGPLAVRVPGVARDIRIKIASERDEWREAFQLVSSNYQARGYEEPFASKVRFTPYHALPDLVTLVAKLEGRVLATFSLVPDNTLLGLPLEGIYSEEIRGLRRERRRLVEVTSFAADKDLRLREFRPVFICLIRFLVQYHLSQGGDTWVLTVNPRHRDFYIKALGSAPLGPPRTYSSVQNHPAEGYWFDMDLMRRSAPDMADELLSDPLPGEALVAPKMLSHLIRYLGDRSTRDARDVIRDVIPTDEFFGSPRRW